MRASIMNTKRGSYAWLRELSAKQFRRLVGVKPRTFKRMVRALEEHEQAKTKAGRSSKLSLEDRLLMTLQYLREYPTLLRLGVDWGVHESTAQRMVTRTEKALLDSGKFSLPGKKTLKPGTSFEVVVVDVAESSIERPKKSNDTSIVARRNATP
jgi:hypothetical protein